MRKHIDFICLLIILLLLCAICIGEAAEDKAFFSAQEGWKQGFINTEGKWGVGPIYTKNWPFVDEELIYSESPPFNYAKPFMGGLAHAQMMDEPYKPLDAYINLSRQAAWAEQGIKKDNQCWLDKDERQTVSDLSVADARQTLVGEWDCSGGGEMIGYPIIFYEDGTCNIGASHILHWDIQENTAVDLFPPDPSPFRLIFGDENGYEDLEDGFGLSFENANSFFLTYAEASGGYIRVKPGYWEEYWEEEEENGISFTLPKEAKERGDYLPLMGDCQIENIFVEVGNESFKSIDGVLFTKDGKALLLYPIGRSEESYSVPEGTERIEDNCSFGYDCNLKTLILPASMRSFCEDNLFRTEIENYIVDPDNPVFCDMDGVLFSKDQKTLIAYPPGKKESNYMVPDGTEIIGECAFHENFYVKSVILPESIHTIGDDAFSFSRIESIHLPKQMKSIGGHAFSYCGNLVLPNFYVPDGLAIIEEGTFEACQMKGTLHIPEGVAVMERGAICFQYQLTDIYWPDSLKYIVNEMDESFMQDWPKDRIDMVFGWNDTGIADFTCVMHAHEGAPAVEWVRAFPHIIAPKEVDTMDVNGYMDMCNQAMQEAGYKDAVICCNPDVKWMAVKPLVAYNLHQAAAVYQFQGRTILCGFDDLNGGWKLRWVNELFFDDGNLPVLFAFYGDDLLRIILPDADSNGLSNAVDYIFNAKTLNLASARYVEDYLWYEYVDLWHCRLHEDTIIYSYPDIWRFSYEDGEYLQEKGADFASAKVNTNTVYLPSAIRIPFPSKDELESESVFQR